MKALTIVWLLLIVGCEPDRPRAPEENDAHFEISTRDTQDLFACLREQCRNWGLSECLCEGFDYEGPSEHAIVRFAADLCYARRDLR